MQSKGAVCLPCRQVDSCKNATKELLVLQARSTGSGAAFKRVAETYEAPCSGSTDFKALLEDAEAAAPVQYVAYAFGCFRSSGYPIKGAEHCSESRLSTGRTCWTSPGQQTHGRVMMHDWVLQVRARTA